jgi:2-oxoglutarate ferredoxin oxidoreductase subunit alpha
VILLTEQDYGQNLRTVKEFELTNIKIDRGKLLSQDELEGIKNYRRYRFTTDGISPRALPGMKNGLHMVESNEHDQYGYRDEDPENRIRMMQKRMRKLKNAAKDLIPPKIGGDRESELGIIGCGSTFGPIQEAIAQLKDKAIRAKYMQIRTLWPFPRKRVEEFLGSLKDVFVVENNFSGKLGRLIRSQVQIPIRMKNIVKYSSQAFRPREISSRIQKAAR